jgi:hypothetical protein
MTDAEQVQQQRVTAGAPRRCTLQAHACLCRRRHQPVLPLALPPATGWMTPACDRLLRAETTSAPLAAENKYRGEYQHHVHTTCPLLYGKYIRAVQHGMQWLCRSAAQTAPVDICMCISAQHSGTDPRYGGLCYASIIPASTAYSCSLPACRCALHAAAARLIPSPQAACSTLQPAAHK